MENNAAVGEVLNVCTGKNTTLNELVILINELLGTPSEVIYDKPRKGDIYSNYGDPLKMKQITGFKAEFWLHNGLYQIINNLK